VRGAAEPRAQAATPASPPALGTSHKLASAEARAAINAFDRAFYKAKSGRAQFAMTTAGGRAQFWKQAEMMEMVEDAYQRSGNATYKRMIGELRAGVEQRFGTDWLRDSYNDDVLWMVIAYARAYQLTRDRTYRAQAKKEFDGVYARASSPDLGGGLWWTTARREKNACVTGPAAIAACLLSRSLHEPSYVRKATALFGWLRSTLFDPTTGAVFDHATPSGATMVVDRSAYTYNEGTFIGAADLLYGATGRADYYNDALLALQYTQSNLTQGGILESEGSRGDGGGFKGIFVRWATGFTKHRGITTFDAWFDQNAHVAWSHRNAANLVGEDWDAPTTAKLLHAFDCSSAVVLLQDRPQ